MAQTDGKARSRQPASRLPDRQGRGFLLPRTAAKRRARGHHQTGRPHAVVLADPRYLATRQSTRKLRPSATLNAITWDIIRIDLWRRRSLFLSRKRVLPF